MASFLSCKETPKTPVKVPASTPVVTSKDTLIGMNGCDNAKFDGKMFTYPSAKVVVKANPNEEAGESIEVNGVAITSKVGSAYHFNGVYKNFLFIDDGTGTNGRHLGIWDIQAKKIIFETPYEGELTLVGGKVGFLTPIDLTKVKLSKPIACPNKAKWEKEGLSIGYGVPHQYDLAKLTDAVAGDIVCFAMQ